MKTEIVIKLSIPELLYDLDNKTYLVGKGIATPDNEDKVDLVQSDERTYSRNQMLRAVYNAHAALLGEINEYTSPASTGTPGPDNLIPEGAETIDIHLSMPGNFNIRMKDSVSGFMHQYIVNSALSEWNLLTSLPDAEKFRKAAAENMLSLHAVLNRRICKPRQSK